MVKFVVFSDDPVIHCPGCCHAGEVELWHFPFALHKAEYLAEQGSFYSMVQWCAEVVQHSGALQSGEVRCRNSGCVGKGNMILTDHVM